MVRIAGVTLPQQKRIEISLMYIYGVGRPLANKILTATQVDPQKRTHALTDDEANRIREEVKNYRVEGDLRREVLMNVKRLREISSYRGSRHGKRLPVRGQRTKTNSRTVRGNVRKTMGSGKKPSAQKT
ncbi:30S ribosomal protein S13 [Candidatus Uhrbacteria bacterium]|nr:30S ribosomal protein S13 [Candidatus Uhrbacteria bacterium]